jgi:Mg2+/Co2+ transporter CorB
MSDRLILLLMLLGSALFSSSELAIMGIPRYKIKRYVRQNASSRTAYILEYLRENPEKTLITILIGNNLINVMLSLYAGQVGNSVLAGFAITGAIGFAIISASITFLILFFGEIMPKVFANRFALTFAQWTAPLIR